MWSDLKFSRRREAKGGVGDGIQRVPDGNTVVWHREISWLTEKIVIHIIKMQKRYLHLVISQY